MNTNKLASTSVLLSLSRVNELDPDLISELSRNTYFEAFQPGESVYYSGDDYEWVFYLISGDVEIIAKQGGSETLSSDAPEAKEPLTNPDTSEVKAKTPVICIRIKEDLLNRPEESTPEVAVSEESIEEKILKDINRELRNGKLKIPSLPDVALQVQEAIKNPDIDVEIVSKIIQADPALALRIIKVANSPVYRGQVAITTCQMAVSRMGLTVTRDLVLSCSLQQIFETDSKLLKHRMRELWEHSTLVAAISSILAHLAPRMVEDRALLSGLVHNIGALPILAYAEKYPELASDEELLDRIIEQNSSKIGVMVLNNWQMDHDLITVVKEANDWMRDPDPKPDYCDLVLLAQLYSYKDTPKMATLPEIDQVPAYSKLPLGRLGPRMSVKVLEDARADIEEIQKLLNS